MILKPIGSHRPFFLEPVLDSFGFSNEPLSMEIVMFTKKHLGAVLVLPATVSILVPAILLYFFPMNYGWGAPEPLRYFLAGIGGFLMLAGIVFWVGSARTFSKLVSGGMVVSGVYRHVRNPMMFGMAALLLGEALITGTLMMLLWWALVVASSLVYVPFKEEKSMEARYGPDFAQYKAGVPRWFPRSSPWRRGRSDE